MKSKLLVALLIAGGALTAQAQSLPSWASPEVSTAWGLGYKGQNTSIIVVDDFSSTNKFAGNWGNGVKTQQHGYWTSSESALIAPSASQYQVDFNLAKYSNGFVLNRGFNVINASYSQSVTSQAGANTVAAYFNTYGGAYGLGPAGSITQYANGQAFVAKSAGNGASTVLGVDKLEYKGTYDALNAALVGKSSAIYVGALSTNGTTANKASMAYYSNTAGTNTTVQNQFLVVGVDTAKTGLAGTSFAAPIVAGYGAILNSKFQTATPTTITNRLLQTARTDTLVNYNAQTYGRGEASLTRALAATAIK